MSPMTYSGASCSSTARRRPASSRGTRARAKASTNRQCCATEKIWAPLVCPFQRATRASPCAISSLSTSSGEGSSRSSRRPDSMRCQARGASLPREGALPGGLGVGLLGNLLNGLMAMTGHDVVVDHADRLHEGIDDGWPAELE